MIDAKRYDLVLMDCQMRSWTGTRHPRPPGPGEGVRGGRPPRRGPERPTPVRGQRCVPCRRHGRLPVQAFTIQKLGNTLSKWLFRERRRNRARTVASVGAAVTAKSTISPIDKSILDGSGNSKEPETWILRADRQFVPLRYARACRGGPCRGGEGGHGFPPAGGPHPEIQQRERGAIGLSDLCRKIEGEGPAGETIDRRGPPPVEIRGDPGPVHEALTAILVGASA